MPKYSPIRNPVPGANNIPMSYAGPPSQAEINRNKGRNQAINAYDSSAFQARQHRTLDDSDSKKKLSSYSNNNGF